ncbi:nuclear transport factor 2 family protein [Streptomyces sp. NPDC002623]
MNGLAQKTAQGFVKAWTSKDVEKALTFIADDAVCEAPNGTFEGKGGFREFLAPFVGAMTGATVIDVLGDDTNAAAVYTTEVPFASNFRGMDYITVKNGKITRVISHFDLSPLIQSGGNPQH